MKTDFDDDVIGAAQYDRDFYTWTQEQAALLRALPRGAFGLDIDNLAEEIEDMGRAEIHKVSSLLRQVLLHLLKTVIAPDSPSRLHWLEEILTFQADAVQAFSPGMKQRVDLDRIWKVVCNSTAQILESSGQQVPAWPSARPLSLDELLATDFDPTLMVSRMKAALQTASGSSPR